MKVQVTKNSVKLASKANVQTSYFCETFAESLLKRGAIGDFTDNYGYSVEEALNEETPVTAVVLAIQDAGIENVTCEDYTTALKCLIIGDGECPECGGEMDVIDEEEKIWQQDYDSEPQHTIIWQEKQCECCGYRKFFGNVD